MLEFEAGIEELSSPGDSFVNFIYSLALSNTFRRPMGRKASNDILSEALLRAGLRERLGSRVTRHEMADYLEGFLFFAWAKDRITLRECVAVLTQGLRRKREAGIREASITAFEGLLSHLDGRL
jgi:hypothetical protein